jgi:hypothetical protein
MTTESRDKKSGKKELSVALLFSDASKAKEISKYLREYSIMAHFYSELDEFWVGIKGNTPDLAIVDIQMMSQGEIVLRNHPLIIDGKLNLAFFYNEGTSPLLNSTFQFKHYGFVKDGLNAKGQIKQILMRREQDVHNQEQVEILEERISRLRKRNAQMIGDIFDIKNMTNQQQLALKLTDKMESVMEKTSFTNALASVLDEWSGIEKFSLYELNNKGDRLVSPDFICDKFMGLPSLYLGQANENGIENFAIDMANQVSRDVIGGEIKIIKIKGKHAGADWLLIAEINETEQVGFSWHLFEMLLSGLYSRSKVGVQEVAMTTEKMPVWDMFDKLDDIRTQKLESKYKIATISLHKLNNIVAERPDNRFYWRGFYKELTIEIEKHLKNEGHYSSYGTKALIILLKTENAETIYNNIKKVIEKFPVYRFFEDAALVVSKELVPSMRVVTASAPNVIRHIEREYDELERAIELASHRAAQIMAGSEV